MSRPKLALRHRQRQARRARFTHPERSPDLDEALAAFPDLDAPVKEECAATFIGVLPATMRNWRWQGRGPEYLAIGEGRRPVIRYLPRVLIRYRAAMRRRSTSAASP
jgi:hypothetical protein